MHGCLWVVCSWMEATSKQRLCSHSINPCKHPNASSAACSWVEAALDDLDIHPVAAMLPKPEAHIVPMVTNEEVVLEGNPDEGIEAREVHTYK